MTHSRNVGRGHIELVVLLDTKLSHLDIFVDIETCMLQSLLRTPHGATINGDQHLARFCRFDHPTDMAPDACKAEISANTLLGQPNGSLIGDLADVGAAGTTENQNFIRFTKAFLFHFSSLLDPALNLLYLWKLSCHLHHSVDNQSRSDEDTVVSNGFDILHLDDLSADT